MPFTQTKFEVLSTSSKYPSFKSFCIYLVIELVAVKVKSFQIAQVTDRLQVHLVEAVVGQIKLLQTGGQLFGEGRDRVLAEEEDF